MRSKVLIILVSILFLVIVYFGYIIYKVNGMQVVSARRGEIVSSVYASGKTKAEKEAHLSFKNTGRIVYLPVKKNQEIKKGQVLASLDTSDLAANKEKELTDYLKTRWDFEQTRDNYKDVIKTDSIKRTLDKSQFDLNNSVTDVEIADRAVKNSYLYSPYDGVITEVNGEVNEWVSLFSTEPLVTIIDPQTVYFNAELEEEDIWKIKKGDKALVTLDAYPKKVFEGAVSEIEKSAIVKENGDTVLPVKVVLDSNYSLPIAGLNGDAQFILQKKKDVLILDKRAIKKRDGSNTVTVKKGLTLKIIVIDTGIADAKNIEVTKGINEGDQIVLPQELE